jgi:hypothetical protein
MKYSYFIINKSLILNHKINNNTTNNKLYIMKTL